MRSFCALILGGARSGKSAHAEHLTPKPAVYLATARAGDAEMTARIAAHRARRGPDWSTREEPLDLVAALAETQAPVLVDCLTLWLANLMDAGRDIDAESEALAEILARRDHATVLVANEVGLGIVPDNALAREFRDHAGRMNQRMARAATRVIFMAAGIPLTLKDA